MPSLWDAFQAAVREQLQAVRAPLGLPRAWAPPGEAPRAALNCWDVALLWPGMVPTVVFFFWHILGPVLNLVSVPPRNRP